VEASKVADIYSLSIRADTSDIRRGRKDLDRFGNQAGKTKGSVASLGSSFTGLRTAVAAVVTTLGAAGLAKSIFATVKSTQVLQASLKTVTGSVEAANTAWADLLEFAKTTPFTLDQSVQGFIRMKSLGLDPTEKALRSFGNTSAAMGKDLMQMIEAVADASTGEFERLKEFGIRASKQGDQITFTFQGVETTVRNSSTAISGYLEEIGNTTFAGAMADQMDTLAGKTSNLEDGVDQLFRAIGEAGATDAFEASIDAAAQTVETLTENVDILKASFAGLAGAAATLTAIAVATRAATVAQIAFNIAARANPYVFLATVLGTAAAAIYSLNDSMDPAIERAQLLKTAIGDLTDNLDLLTRSELENRKASFAQDMIESRTEAEKLAAKLETVQDIIKNSGQLTPQGGAMQIATSEDINRARELKAQIDELNLAADASSGSIEKVNALIESLGEKSETSSTELEKAAKAADNYASVISALNPAQAEFTRYADQLDMIDSFNISAGEKEALREESFRQHQERMNAIASEGNAGMTEQASINKEASGIAASLMSEEASIRASYERRRDIVLDSTNITGKARNNLLVQLEKDKIDKIKEIQDQADADSKALLVRQQTQTLNHSASFFGNLAAIAQKGGEDQFQAYQNLASAQAAISAASAIASTLGDPTVPSFLRVPLAFSIGALAVAQVAQIQSQTYSGARAMGGSVTGGNSYMVGENGPEVVTMGGSGVVTPSSVGGGGSTNIVINDQTTTSTGHDVQTQETTGPEGQRQMQVTIRDTVRRQVMQGEFDRQLGSKFDLKSKGRRV
jgi:hypothetical protein